MISKGLLTGDEYLFRRMAEGVEAYKAAHPTADVIDMGVGDVSVPLAPVVVDALRLSSAEMGSVGFRGYSPALGYDFARYAVATYYQNNGIDIQDVQFAIGSGAKDELALWSNVIDRAVPALIPCPAYPAYADASRAVGRQVVYAYAAEQGRLLLPCDVPEGRYLVYLCSPNNPTGLTYSAEEMQCWVDFACRTGSLLLVDAAYAAFGGTSIFACRDAEKCAVEVGTLSKSASFSGLRFGWSAVGADIEDGEAWRAYCRAKSVLSNGVPYVVQRAGEAALSPEGLKYSHSVVATYMRRSARLADALLFWGLQCTAGPYVWVRLPRGVEDPFGYYLDKAQIVLTDGAGFGARGEGFARLSVFGVGDRLEEVIDRLQRVFVG